MTEMNGENLTIEKSQEIKSYNQELADSITENLRHSLVNIEFVQILKFCAALVILIILLKLFFWLINKVKIFLFKRDASYNSIKFKNLVLVESSTINKFINMSFFILKAVISIFIFYSFLAYILSIFPKTQGIADTLISYFYKMIMSFIRSCLGFVPNILTIAFIIIITYYLLEFIKFIARSLFSKKISLSGFKREWIIPTYKIAQFFIIIFAIIAIFPYLPGSGSPAFKGVSVFVGLLITLGSSTAIANTIAGLILIYMSPYGVGDRVKIDQVIGDITEIGLLVTRLRTIKNEDVTIPNSKILSQETINYTDSTQSKKPLLLYVEITIGYNIDWQKVEESLLKSAKNIEGIDTEEQAFVLVKDLESNFIRYELNLPIKEASQILNIKSILNKNILDNFKEAGIEILSPSYHTIRKEEGA